MIASHAVQITPEILRLIAGIDEFKGAWRTLGMLAPDRLAALRRVATIESIDSSTRIEGSRLSDDGKPLGVVFATATRFDTPSLMAELISWFNAERQTGQFHPLLLIGIWIVVFLERVQSKVRLAQRRGERRWHSARYKWAEVR